MAEFRERPYGQFNFLVDLGTGDTSSAQAGFQEVSGLGMEITVAEYRNGNEKDNAPRKMTGMYKVPDITLKRGVIGSTGMFCGFTALQLLPLSDAVALGYAAPLAVVVLAG